MEAAPEVLDSLAICVAGIGLGAAVRKGVGPPAYSFPGFPDGGSLMRDLLQLMPVGAL